MPTYATNLGVPCKDLQTTKNIMLFGHGALIMYGIFQDMNLLLRPLQVHGDVSFCDVFGPATNLQGQRSTATAKRVGERLDATLV